MFFFKKNTKSKEPAKSLFFSKKESWWVLAFSMILSGGILVEPQIITSTLTQGGLSEMWVIWSGVLGVAFGKSFFAHLWLNIPVKTENEIILFRFSGLGAKVLHIFRSVYVGAIIVPIIISFNILAFSRLISFCANIPMPESILISTSLIILGSFFNSFHLRVKIDFVLMIVFIILFTVIIYALLENTGGLSTLNEKVRNAGINFNIFPDSGTTAFNSLLIFLFVQWWSTAIVDFPDMQGQKLLASKNSGDIVKIILFPTLIVMVFNIFAFTLPFLAVTSESTKGISDPEMAFVSVFLKFLPTSLLILAVLMFLIQFLSIAHNNQNWGGSLLIENLYKTHIKPQASNNELNKIGRIVMLLLVIGGGIIAYYSKSIFEMTKYLLTITAGVGPVFMLRWYWWRINAWSQLSAMISALIYPTVYDLLYDHIPAFTSWINQLCLQFNISHYPLKVIILTIIVCATWLTVTFLTPKTDSQKIKKFAETVKPGGIWPKETANGKSYMGERLLAWILQAFNGILVYLIFWNFVSGNYLQFIAYLFLFGIIFIFTFIIIKRVNLKYAQSC